METLTNSTLSFAKSQITKLAGRVAVLGLLLCSSARAQIALQDGSLNVASTGGPTVTMNFTVTTGASVLVVSLVDRNSDPVDETPATIAWIGGQTLTKVISTNNAGASYANSSIYCLYNPTPGTATLSASDTPGTTTTVMVMQAYTLNGVNTNVPPATYAINSPNASSLEVTTSASTPAGAWAVVNGTFGNGAIQLTASSTSGTVDCPSISHTITESMGYVSNLSGANSTITLTAASQTQKMGLTVAVFSPPNAQVTFPFQEIRTASDTELVAFLTSPAVTGPVYATVYPTNLVTIGNPSSWTLNGQPVTAINEFVTEANAVEYHIYLQVPPMTNGMSYTLNTPYGSTNFVFEDTQMFCESIKVNQNGYSALSQTRYANFAIWLGTGGSQPISGPLPAYTVFNQFTGQQVATGTLQAVASAQPDSSSGDYVYRIDLSSVPAGGPYIISVSGYGRSYPFGVGGNFSSRLGYVAFRGLYYQRCGCSIVQPYAWANLRPYPDQTNVYDEQYPSDSFTTAVPTNGLTPLIVHGGYHDASNPPRYAYHLQVPMVLMTTYEAFPQDFTSNQFNIPVNFDSSFNILPGGNGIPDILNEASWCLMFFTNVQSTANEPAGAIPFGDDGFDDGAPWGDNMDEDPTLYTTITNVGWDCGLAAGAFMNFARLIQPYNPSLSSNYEARAIAAYNAAGGRQNEQESLYYNIQYYLLTGNVGASNYIEANYTQTSTFPSTYNDEPGGLVAANGRWMANFFMSYIIATNRPTDPTVVAYFKSVLQQAANQEVGYVTNDAYPVGWPASVNPYTQNSFAHGPFTAQGQFAYPCLMEWAVTGQQKYIDAVSQMMDYDQGLNPLGKCYMTGIGFNRVHNPEINEGAVYAEEQGWGGPQPGVTIYGPGTNTATSGIPEQIPAALSLPRERQWVDDLGNFQWNEFTVCQCEMFPAAIYEVLAQGAPWLPSNGEPFLNPAASILSDTNGWSLQFGGLPGQSYYLQVATNVTGPWTNLAGPVGPNAAGLVQFTDATPASKTRFYRTVGTAPIY